MLLYLYKINKKYKELTMMLGLKILVGVIVSVLIILAGYYLHRYSQNEIQEAIAYAITGFGCLGAAYCVVITIIYIILKIGGTI